MGIGSKLMRVFRARMDAAGEEAYLETDRPVDVPFYERFGFEVVGKREVVLEVPNWFTLRRVERREG
jgi:predicted N-acetyltransferase YhbS